MPASLLFGALLFSGCRSCHDDMSDGDPWAFGSAGDVAVDAAHVPDHDHDTRPDSRTCRPMVVVDAAGGPAMQEVTRPIVLSGDRWYFLRQRDDGRRDLWARAAIHAEPELVRANVTTLLDGGPRGVLFIADGQILLLNDGDAQVLGTAENNREWERAPYLSAAYRFVGEQGVTWMQDGMWYADYSGTTQFDVRLSSLPYARDGRVAWSTSSDATAPGLRVFENGRQHVLDEVNSLNVALSSSHLWFVRNGSTLFRVPLEGLATAVPQPVQVPDGRDCDRLAVSDDGRWVAASCAVDSDGVAHGLYVSAGGEDWSLTAEHTAPSDTFAVDDGAVVFAKWSQAPARLFVARRGEAAIEIAPIETGCLSCGAYWPPNYVLFENGKLAWNYAVGDAEGPLVGMADLCP